MLVKVERTGWTMQVKEYDSFEDIMLDLSEGCTLSPATDDDKFEYIIESYKGTCSSITSEDQEWLEEKDMLGRLDEEIFNCIECGWWYETGEEGDGEHDEPTCGGCEYYS